MQLLTKTIATSLTLILMLAACDGAQRDLESQIARSNDGTGSGQIETPTDQNGTVEMLPPSGGTVNDENSTVGEIKVDAKNAYRVTVTFSDTYTKRGYFSRDEIGTLHFDITNLYTGTAADTKKIEEITLEAEEMNTPTDGKYLNFITFDGKEGPKYTIPSDSVKASDDVALKIKTLSGTTNIILKVTIAGMPSPYTLKIPVVIEKNKSSSMAIVPIGSRYENGLYIDKFVIHVVDSYGNKAKDGTHISTGVINNPKLYSNAYNGAIKSAVTQRNDVDVFTSDDLNITWLNYPDHSTIANTSVSDTELPTNDYGIVTGYDWQAIPYTIKTTSVDENNKTVTTLKTAYDYIPNIYGVSYKNDTGTLNGTTKTFKLNPANPADDINPNSDITALDTLIVLANKKHHKPEILGGYDISSIDTTNNEISLVSVNDNLNLSGLTYVIGDEYRYIDEGQTIANGAISTFESTEVKDGVAYAELRYTPEMVGKNVFIYANTVLDDKRIGISRNVLLHGTGMSQYTLSCTNDKGLRPNCSQRFRITLNDSGKGAYHVNIGTPQIAGDPVYRMATASRTDKEGWTTVSIYGIDENKTATVTFGNLIFDEYIINQK